MINGLHSEEYCLGHIDKAIGGGKNKGQEMTFSLALKIFPYLVNGEMLPYER
jgi:hypothetical protein